MSKQRKGKKTQKKVEEIIQELPKIQIQQKSVSYQESTDGDGNRMEIGSDSDVSSDSYLQTGLVLRQKAANELVQYNKILQVEKQLTSTDGEAQQEIIKFKKMLVQHIENRILNAQKKFEESVQEELEQFEDRINATLTNIRDEHYYNLKLNRSKAHIPQMEKSFKYKPSLLSEMLKQSDYKTLYHMIVASMLVLVCNLMTQDYLYKGMFFDIETFLLCFSGLTQAIQSLLLIFSWGYMSILIVRLYKFHKVPFPIIILIYGLLQFGQIFIPAYLATSSTTYLGFGSKCILLCEGARMGLKNHSYIRNKLLYGTQNQYKTYIPPSLAKKGLTEKSLKLPEITIGPIKQEIQRYTYFMLAPTLIYRDHYVRAPHRNNITIMIESGNFLMSIYYGFIMFKTFCKEPILELRDNLTISGFLIVIFKLMMPSTFALMLLFFGLLHSWLNAWAELLRFPDRTFYLDWWTSSEFGQYYRKWNIVVHEFLYYYVYLDTQKLSFGKIGRGGGQFLTFFISAIIHEVILYFALGFFYPICFLLFTGPGILFIRSGQKIFKKQWFNIVFWVLMYAGTSLMITLYLVEFYAREKISDNFMYQQWGLLEFIIPRTFYLS